ncbi:reverse transcriptase domain-containing protein [Tanacetum coccineum]
MFRKEYIRIESSTQHSSVNDFVIINIPEEDVEPKQIILDPDDQPMWESAKTVAPTPNSAIIQLDVDDNFVINSTHLNMIRENKFDGYLRADPHDHIREFLAICNMFRYGETQSEAVKLLIFPFSLTGPPPPQAQTEQGNVVFTGSGKSDDSSKTQKNSPPPIIVNNKIGKDKPIKTSKGNYHIATTKEYSFQVVEIESLKSSTHHSPVNEFVVINIPEEDVEPKQIILDPDDQPMWESAKTVAPTPNSAIIQLDVDDNFVINSTHLNMIRENKFDGYLQADPHDHIREFLAICNMFKYGKTWSESVKLLIFPFSLCDEAKTRFNDINKESITSWELMRKAFINRFFPPSLFNRLLLEIRNFSQLVCESLTEAWLRLKHMLRKCHGHGHRSLVTTEEHASKMPWERYDQRSYYSNILSRPRRTYSSNPRRNS